MLKVAEVTGPLQYSSTSFNRGELEFSPGFVLFLHASTGCDITSALFWYGKNKLWGAVQKYIELITIAEQFLQSTATHETIADSGAKCLVAVYRGHYKIENLHSLRYKIFVKTAASAKCKKGCTGGEQAKGCTCLKAGLRCSSMCKFCTGVSCQNVVVIPIDEKWDDNDDDIDDPLPVITIGDSQPPSKRTK
ncbi:hypothetical protein NQ318_002692 [Aromia moschata]|uniref:Tesmin/TSO1-like CXC domain-containing protein n=1 Tax=Aromia moschata TaxID=1265417 RepID=A0AAV8Y4K4_9CUCU|nr:hypothetical protein NQ318_002692 [Aromia moschata]